MRRFPFCRQFDSMDCGPACLKMISSYYGKDVPLQTLRDYCRIQYDGVSLLGVRNAAKRIGLESVGVRVSWEQFKSNVTLPAIVHWNQKHFIVAYKLSSARKKINVCVADPAIGFVTYDEQTFRTKWEESGSAEGIALMLRPSDHFQCGRDNDERVSLKSISLFLRPFRSLYWVLLLAMAFSGIITYFLPKITQEVVDNGILSQNITLVGGLLAGQFALVIGYTVNNIIRSRLTLFISSRVGISFISDFLSKLMKLPISFFELKSFGDIIQRIRDYDRIQFFLTDSFLGVLLAIVSLCVYSAISMKFDFYVFAVFIIGSLLYFICMTLFLKKRKTLDFQRFQEYAADHNNVLQIVDGVQDIKLFGCAERKKLEWEHIQQRLFDINLKLLKLSNIQELSGAFIEQSKNIIISYFAAMSVIKGDMTLGMMMSLQYIIGQLNAPMSRIISFIQETQDVLISCERINEVKQLRNEEQTVKQDVPKINQNSVNIRLVNLSFQYNESSKIKVLDNLNFTIPAGKVTAITGASGSGKTTLLKILQGLYEPTGGSVLINGIPLSQYGIVNWRKLCSSVMQEGYIFSETIAKNIAIVDDVPDMKKVVKSATIAKISNWIESLSLGYNTEIGGDGHKLSMGQRQRILIARAVYRDVPVLILDEATNSLDANNEQDIMNNLSEMFLGKTVIVVAHRLSTIMNADQIIVLDKGGVAEKGIHEDLMLKKGKYYELVKKQLA